MELTWACSGKFSSTASVLDPAAGEVPQTADRCNTGAGGGKDDAHRKDIRRRSEQLANFVVDPAQRFDRPGANVVVVGTDGAVRAEADEKLVVWPLLVVLVPLNVVVNDTVAVGLVVLTGGNDD